jgi:plasmid stabilization system protein ParE
LSFTFRVSPRADRQIRAAARWWLEHRSKGPTLFADELDAAFALIEELPFAGETVPHSRIATLRRVLLGGVQYHVYYVVSEQRAEVEVLALWHTSRGTAPRL